MALEMAVLPGGAEGRELGLVIWGMGMGLAIWRGVEAAGTGWGTWAGPLGGPLGENMSCWPSGAGDLKISCPFWSIGWGGGCM